ncbi:MAG TPA: FAD-binding oxidoreductase [Gemmatimonadaceae bacterium]
MSTTPSTELGVRESFARDASGLVFIPESVARPASQDEVVELLRRAVADRVPVTAAGGQTSTTGASISEQGMILSLRALDRVLGIDEERRTVRVESGVLLGPLKRQLAAEGWLLAPDPTSEEDVTIGGAVACNASGARTLRYGAMRAHVAALRVLLANGEVHELRRPGLEKNTAGYAFAQDPVDWFVGSEGTLGVVLEAELALLPLPPRVLGIGIPFASEEAALGFVVAARDAASVHPRCLEYFDERALAIARRAQGDDRWAAGAGALVYVEETSGADEEPPLEDWLALAEAHGAIADDLLVFDGESQLRDARRIRHAVPAYMNEQGATFRPAGGRKLSTDWAVPHRKLALAIAEARRLADAAGIEQAVTYGHAGNGHPHQNFLARDADEKARIEAVIEDTLRWVLRHGGTVSAEHGIGKLKRKWLPLQATRMQLGAMRALKRELDPLGLLAQGNVL